MHVGVVGDVVAAVAERRRIERQDPDRGDAEVAEVVELVDQPVDVTGAVAARVLERADVDLVDDRVLVPVRIVGQVDDVVVHRKYSKWFSLRTKRLTSKICAGSARGSSSTKLRGPRHVTRA